METASSSELWRELPQFKDAESCVGAGMTWIIKLANPQVKIPQDVEARINAAKLGKCKENIPLSWILGSLQVFEGVKATIYVEDSYYLAELKNSIPDEFSSRINVQLGDINSREIKGGKYGVCSLLVDKYDLDGLFHVVHTVVVDPETSGNGDWITFSDPWTGKEKRMLPDNHFDKAISSLNSYLGWGKILVSVGPKDTP